MVRCSSVWFWLVPFSSLPNIAWPGVKSFPEGIWMWPLFLGGWRQSVAWTHTIPFLSVATPEDSPRCFYLITELRVQEFLRKQMITPEDHDLQPPCCSCGRSGQPALAGRDALPVCLPPCILLCAPETVPAGDNWYGALLSLLDITFSCHTGWLFLLHCIFQSLPKPSHLVAGHTTANFSPCEWSSE